MIRMMLHRSTLLAAAAVALSHLAVPVSSQLAAQEGGTVGTVVIAHGGGAEWNQPVLDAARGADTGGPVDVSFLMGDSAHVYRFQDAVQSGGGGPAPGLEPQQPLRADPLAGG